MGYNKFEVCSYQKYLNSCGKSSNLNAERVAVTLFKMNQIFCLGAFVDLGGKS